MSTLPSGSDNRSEAMTPEFTLAQSTHANSNTINLIQQMFLQLRGEIGTFRSEMATKMQKQRDEQTTTLIETVSHMNEKTLMTKSK